MIKEKQIEEAKDYLMNKLDRENAKRQDSWLKTELVNIYQYLQKQQSYNTLKVQI
jgi:hypothetical protein